MVARGAAKPLSKLELAGRTVRQLLEGARQAGVAVPPGTNKQPLVDLLVKAKVTSAHLGDVGMQVAPPVVLPEPRDDDSSASTSDTSTDSTGSDTGTNVSQAKKKARRTKRHDSDSDDDDEDDDEDDDSPFAVLARHTGVPARTLRRIPKNWGEMDVVLSPILWVYMFVTHPVKFTKLRKAGSLLPGSLFRGVVLMLEMRFPDAPRGFVTGVMNDLCAAHDLCTAAAINCKNPDTKGFDWTFFLRLHGNTIAKWSEHISGQTDADIVSSFGDATAAVVRAQRRICEKALPVGQKEILQRAMKKRRLEESSVPVGAGGVSGANTGKSGGRKCRRCRMVVVGPFAAHNKKGVCPKK